MRIIYPDVGWRHPHFHQFRITTTSYYKTQIFLLPVNTRSLQLSRICTSICRTVCVFYCDDRSWDGVYVGIE